MFQKVGDADLIRGEHEMLKFWTDRAIFAKRRALNAGRQPWSFLDGPMTANNPMGVHHAWGRTYKDAFQRYWAMNGRDLRYQNGFDCQGLWVEVEVEKQLGLGAKSAIEEFGVDKFVWECKKRVLKYAAVQTEQSVRLGYWMEWDDPQQLRKLAEAIGTDQQVEFVPPKQPEVTVRDTAEHIVERLGSLEWGGSYFTFSTDNNETIWTFLKKCFERGKVYRGHDVMPWSGRGGSAYSQMEVADGRKLTVHRALFVKFPLLPDSVDRRSLMVDGQKAADSPSINDQPLTINESLLIWTTTPWTLTSNVAAMVNPDLEYVKLRAKRDGAVYYFAKDNLEYQRLAKEFKEGFGRPEWGWPKDCPKLKTLSQMFKEQGGYEVEGTVLGKELIGRRYVGPFDDLPAQSIPGGYIALNAGDGYGTGDGAYGSGTADGGGWGDSHEADVNSARMQHRVIDGGRDFKGNHNVVAGEGTGIVHSAPGCGDIDHKIGVEHNLPVIAPLREDGVFGENFGEFTGRSATDPETVDLVIRRLKEKGLLVAEEKYPHIYPFCWRTGDELVFRLVDEWFINMDWREEIMDVTRQIRWLPDSIQGQDREVEWLSIMRDWMISKKRFWGLALPIWVDPANPSDFFVVGDLKELEDLAVDGWDEFQGHTPHKPWIDKVKIRRKENGEFVGPVLHRVPDVGNPWLDAGIVPFSTLGYNTDRDYWQKWFPADLVTECFPGQFRNWFYSMLALATMMRHEEATAAEKQPFKTLLGHRLVMNEEGKPMHKSDGTAIWFEEAAEQLGVDTMRWMYLAQNPASDLKFGTRHPDQKVTLPTVNGPTDRTIDGMETCLVTSSPSDEVRRQVLLPLWNSYAFFVNYARLDGFDPTLGQIPVAERPEIDRWILSNLQALIGGMRSAWENYDSPEACRLAAGYIDDLTNWYIRRNRRRFWRSRDAADTDKLAAYQTLYEVLVSLTKLLAPMIPFLSERMYQNLVVGTSDKTPNELAQPPESVHLCDYPTVNEPFLDAGLNERMSLAQQVVKMGHNLRERANLRVRQPLSEFRIAVGSLEEVDAMNSLRDIVAEEINVKEVTCGNRVREVAQFKYRLNMKTAGPKFGKHLNAVRRHLEEAPISVLEILRNGGMAGFKVRAEDGSELEVTRQDVIFDLETLEGWVAADDRGVQVALSTHLTPELLREGMARDFIRQIQQLRKDANLEIEQRIRIGYASDSLELATAIAEWGDTIRGETLADSLTASDVPAESKSVSVGDAKIQVWMEAV